MNRKTVMAILAVCVMGPAASQAQGRPRVRVESGPYGVFSFSDNRGRIGVIVDARANTAGDKVGARIDGITPGGPAEKAGLKAGDVITRFNGTALGGVAPEDDEDSGPGMKLIELARDLDPGDTVQVEYRRGTAAAKKLTLVAENLGGDFERVPGMGAMKGLMGPEMHFGPGSDFELAFRTPWGGIELVRLNPELGEYFGTREGVLVVSAPDDSSLALKGGDVILTIGGRKPSSPTQAMRILGTYEAGESVAIDVMRKQKRVTLTWKVPEREDHWKYAPRMREEPSRYRLRPKVEEPAWKTRDVVRTTRAI
jgi:C-terminal processing protease CtpA/Prc